MSHEEDDREYQSTSSIANEAIKKGNFKALYNKKYGDLFKVSKQSTFTPEQLFDLAVKYFTWAEENALKAAETASFQGIVTENLVHKVRVFTLNGLCLFCGITVNAIHNWRGQPGFGDVVAFIDGVIYEQKFQLAANGIINAGFIGKEIGIDKAPEINVAATAAASSSAPTTEEVKAAVKDILGEL